MRIFALTGFAALALFASPAFAFTTESVPTDAHGVAYADPDDQVDMQNTPSAGGQAQGFNFGNTSVWMGQSSGGQGSPDAVQTGSQMFDPAFNGGYSPSR